jgi:hypothetical protein
VKLRIELDSSFGALQRGSRVTATVHALDGGPARSVDAWLELVEHAPDFRHVATCTDPIRIHDGRIPPGHAMRLALRVPADALPSLETEWGALRWTLVVRVDRALRPDIREELDVEVT